MAELTRKTQMTTGGPVFVYVDEEADKYMNIVFELCTAYERQSYIEGLKVGARLMAELMEV